MRAQKEQQKYSSVDGQGAGQQKMMMIVMTGMFAIFSFMYSSAFSIYLIVSNLFSLGSTLVINKIVDKTAENKDAKAAEKKFNERYGGRVAAARSAGQKSARDQKNKKTGNNANGKNKK
jgi:membrane protein insertase Oxa1/YidC/SpoIIIJ